MNLISITQMPSSLNSTNVGMKNSLDLVDTLLESKNFEYVILDPTSTHALTFLNYDVLNDYLHENGLSLKQIRESGKKLYTRIFDDLVELKS